MEREEIEREKKYSLIAMRRAIANNLLVYLGFACFACVLIVNITYEANTSSSAPGSSIKGTSRIPTCPPFDAETSGLIMVSLRDPLEIDNMADFMSGIEFAVEPMGLEIYLYSPPANFSDMGRCFLLQYAMRVKRSLALISVRGAGLEESIPNCRLNTLVLDIVGKEENATIAERDRFLYPNIQYMPLRGDVNENTSMLHVPVDRVIAEISRYLYHG